MRSTARLTSPALWARALAVFAVSLAMSAGAVGQEPEDPANWLKDFVHYSRIAKVDLAAGWGQRLLQSGLTNAELAKLVDEGEIALERFEAAIARNLMVPELEAISADIARRVELGRLDLARDMQRIDQAIGMLAGTQRERLLARSRLQAAGEYAVSALLRQITEGRDERLKLACQNMLRDVGRQAVTPLCEALPHVDPLSQRIVCEIVGDIGYPHAAPYLRELSADPSADGPVREAAARALRLVGGVEADLSVLYGNLGYMYYDELGSLIAYPYEEMNNIWAYDWSVGLVPEPVPTVIYNEIMAMRMAAKALELDPANRPALSLFVAANLKRENDLPAGRTDPVFGEAAYSPEFYATVFGAQVCLDVLGLAIDTKDTPLVRDAITALSQTTGGSNLFSPGEGRQPLLEAVSYPDRRVQYEAALTLARALPQQRFRDDFRVVPLLASAVRTAGQSFAMVIADNEENRRQAVINLENLDFTVVGAEGSISALSGAIGAAPGVDLVLVRYDKPDAVRQAVEDLRDVAKTAAAPVLVLAPSVDVPELARDYHGNPRVSVSRPGISDEAFAAVIDELLQRAVGGRMTEARAEAYAIESLAALRDIAISGSPAYDIVDAQPALLDALDARSGGTRLLVADILAMIGTATSQQKLFDAALAASEAEQVDLLERVAASVKRFGNLSDERHMLALLDLVRTSEGDTADAAARVHGALNLPSAEAVGLIHGR